jgi:enoyl-[acyl-carrier protein] reductase I
MGLMDGKVALVFGVANKNSIAWGITQRFHEEGATIGLTYAGEVLEKRVFPLAQEIGCDFVESCDVTKDEDLDVVFEKVRQRFGRIDVLVHSIAYAPREDLGGRFLDVSRNGFQVAMDVSAYSLIAIARRAVPLMTNGGSIMSMTYHASEKVMPGYHVMAIAKSALESITRYLANDLGQMDIRVNAISAGPIKTLAGAGVPGLRTFMRYSEQTAPMRKLVSQREVGDTAVYLASDLSRSVTGEVIYVDAGFHILGMTLTDEDLKAFNTPSSE